MEVQGRCFLSGRVIKRMFKVSWDLFKVKYGSSSKCFYIEVEYGYMVWVNLGLLSVVCELREEVELNDFLLNYKSKFYDGRVLINEFLLINNLWEEDGDNIYRDRGVVFVGGVSDVGEGVRFVVDGCLKLCSVDGGVEEEGVFWFKNGLLRLFAGGRWNIINRVGGLYFKGNWDASVNEPDLSSYSGVDGDFFIVSVGGSYNLGGISDWDVGDWVVFTVDRWYKVDNSERVLSVNNKVGDVVLGKDDVGLGNVVNKKQMLEESGYFNSFDVKNVIDDDVFLIEDGVNFNKKKVYGYNILQYVNKYYNYFYDGVINTNSINWVEVARIDGVEGGIYRVELSLFYLKSNNVNGYIAVFNRGDKLYEFIIDYRVSIFNFFSFNNVFDLKDDISVKVRVVRSNGSLSVKDINLYIKKLR